MRRKEACNCKGGSPHNIFELEVLARSCEMSPGETCGQAIMGGVPVELTCDPETDTCSTPSFFVMITNVPAPPSGRMLVSFMPEPGTLPELFTEDDRQIIEFSSIIPTVSTWGLVALTLLIVSVGSVLIRRRGATCVA